MRHWDINNSFIRIIIFYSYIYKQKCKKYRSSRNANAKTGSRESMSEEVGEGFLLLSAQLSICYQTRPQVADRRMAPRHGLTKLALGRLMMVRRGTIPRRLAFQATDGTAAAISQHYICHFFIVNVNKYFLQTHNNFLTRPIRPALSWTVPLSCFVSGCSQYVLKCPGLTKQGMCHMCHMCDNKFDKSDILKLCSSRNYIKPAHYTTRLVLSKFCPSLVLSKVIKNVIAINVMCLFLKQ